MLGKDARSKVAVGVAALVAAAGFATGTAQAGQNALPPKADPFIQVQDVVTNKGQRPHVVVTYGNAGGRTLDWLDYRCWVVSGDSVRRFSITHETHRNPLMPGQNANFEFWAKAVKRGVTKFRCSIIGFEWESGKERSALSNVATIKVVR
jgi:hypothetical protein